MAGDHGQTVSLLGPDLLAECVVHVRLDGTFQVQVGKFPPSRESAEAVVKAVIGAGFELAKMYGIRIQRAEMTDA